MKDYVLVGTQPLLFPDWVQAEPRAVSPSAEGTPFRADLEAAMEASLMAGGAIRLATPEAPETEEAPRARRGAR